MPHATRAAAYAARVRTRLAASLKRFAANKRAVAAAQIVALVVLLVAFGYGIRDVWPDAAPRLRSADLVDAAVALLVLAAYYLAFVIGWLWILASLGIRIPYRIALQAEMLSMLAKYIPGGVWTPAARVVALRRFGVGETPVVLASIALEAGLSAVAGVLVFLASLALVDSVDAPLFPLLLFGSAVVVALHPRVFAALAKRLLRPFGATEVPPLRYRTALSVLAFYVLTWPLGGLALFFLVRSVGGDPDVSAIPFLGGASAVGAIVAVLAVFAPSGLGVREASMYGLILAVAAPGVALGATVLNRLAITVVEALLLLAAAVAWRRRTAPGDAAEPAAPAPGVDLAG